MPVDYLLRPMRADDVPAVERLTDEVFHDVEVRLRRVGDPEPTRRSPEQAASWQVRVRHMVAEDPEGCFVAENDAGVVGAAVSLRRELTWLLSTFAVRPDLQGNGVGRQLLDAALGYGRGCLRGIIASSDDPAAIRRYRLAGFSLQPTMTLRGRVTRAALPVVERVREGTVADVDLMDSVDRRTRDAGHGVDHPLLASMYRLLVVDRPTGTGYAYVAPGGGPYLLAATNRRTAVDLLWETLAASSPDRPVEIRRVTPANEWALDVGLAALLTPRTDGHLALRHLKPPAPYLPSGHFL